MSVIAPQLAAVLDVGFIRAVTALFFGVNGIKVMPVVIAAVVVSFVLSKWLAGPPPAPKVPEPEEAAVPPQVR